MRCMYSSGRNKRQALKGAYTYISFYQNMHQFLYHFIKMKAECQLFFQTILDRVPCIPKMRANGKLRIAASSCTVTRSPHYP
jgi:hypothetical protein